MDWTCFKNEIRLNFKNCAFQGNERQNTKKSHPWETWRRTVERERCEIGFRTWAVAERIAMVITVIG